MKLFLLVVLWALQANLYAQQDTVAYRAASAIQNADEKIQALEAFAHQYPSSKFLTRAYDGLFDLYAEQSNEPAAVGAASKSLGTLSPENRMSPYNRFAYALAEQNIGLDSALVWIDRAVAMAEKSKSRNLSGFQDSRAYVLYRKGRVAEAEHLQRIAINGHEDDPEYLTHLALYAKENGKLQEGLMTIAKALYLGGDREAKQHFLGWIEGAEQEKSKREELKKLVLTTTVHSFIDTLKGSALIAAQSNAAMLMAGLNVDLATAKQWAERANSSLNKKSSVNDVLAFKQSLALVLAAQGKHKEALPHFRAIEDLVDPYETKYWNALGTTYENVGDRRNAIRAYLQGLLPRNDKQLRSALEIVYKEEYGAIDGIANELDLARQSNVDFVPGHYGKQTTPSGKVILAELFTGAECGPCVGSDMAFDALSEYYPKSALAILEYHVHIPGPDPMTTNESWDRYTWYSGQGTPTVVIDGRESMVGGGPKTVTKNRFGLYRYAIRKYETEKPKVNISIALKVQLASIVVRVQVARTRTAKDITQPILHIALVERSVDYTGANGIAKHAFVVRGMIDGAEGTALAFKRASETVTKEINLEDVENGIREICDSPSTQRSWSNRRPFTGWKARPEKLIRSNLAVVVWVQDMITKEVLQAAYQELPRALGMN